MVRTSTNDRVWWRMLSIQWCEVPNTGRITSLRERYASVRLRARNSTAAMSYPLDAHVCRSYARRSQSAASVGCDRGLSNDFLDRFPRRLVDCDARLIKHGRPSDGRPPFV
jgi:hypothetical protein